KGMEGAIAAKTVTYDFERLMEGAKLLKCSEFGDAQEDHGIPVLTYHHILRDEENTRFRHTSTTTSVRAFTNQKISVTAKWMIPVSIETVCDPILIS
ncbi:hypothetical protein, partial [Klebsiella pneumoniae]|uniref:hypothetical protein n=1 Tax=Klebsiella pneumoniae TaxID=573 RepID=UPI00210ABB92